MTAEATPPHYRGMYDMIAAAEEAMGVVPNLHPVNDCPLTWAWLCRTLEHFQDGGARASLQDPDRVERRVQYVADVAVKPPHVTTQRAMQMCAEGWLREPTLSSEHRTIDQYLRRELRRLAVAFLRELYAPAA